MKKKKYIWICLIVCFLISVSGVSSQVQSADKVPIGQVAMHLLGKARFEIGNGYNVGVFTFIEGIPFSQVFDPDYFLPPEKRAFFTWTAPWTADEVHGRIGELYWYQSHPGYELCVWYDDSHNQDWDDHNTFGDGVLVAVFRIGRLQTLAGPIEHQYGRVMGSAELIKSFPFEIDGTKYDFFELLPGGITVSLFGYTPNFYAGSALAKESFKKIKD
ncbi:MAG: hypothetical protein ACFFCW_30270 [Candidatus Hodarchaeota archaeon]